MILYCDQCPFAKQNISRPHTMCSRKKNKQMVQNKLRAKMRRAWTLHSPAARVWQTYFQLHCAKRFDYIIIKILYNPPTLHLYIPVSCRGPIYPVQYIHWPTIFKRRRKTWMQTETVLGFCDGTETENASTNQKPDVGMHWSRSFASVKNRTSQYLILACIDNIFSGFKNQNMTLGHDVLHKLIWNIIHKFRMITFCRPNRGYNTW